jgi:uroporphyrinogen decarboxylase
MLREPSLLDFKTWKKIPFVRVMNNFKKLVYGSRRRVPMLIAVYPGIHLTRHTIKQVVCDAEIQTKVIIALQKRLQTPVVQTGMDLSVEAEAFGAPVELPDYEVPTVTSPIIFSVADAQKLAVPRPGAGRTIVYLRTAELLRKSLPGTVVLGGCVGPFTLASRLIGLSEACMMAMTEPDTVNIVLEKCTEFLKSYVSAFRSVGADGVIMAEPAAGLLSPDMMEQFSIKWINRVANFVDSDDDFGIILHNCGAKPIHIETKSKAAVSAFHFGSTMDIHAALDALPSSKPVCGNLDPSAIFVQGKPEEVFAKTTLLLKETQKYPNFVPSSGCDIPPQAPLENLDAFIEAVKVYNSAI